MADRNSVKHLPLRTPRIDEDGDILVSSPTTSSSEFDPAFDSTENSETSTKKPEAYSKRQATPSTSHLLSDAGHARTEKHTVPTLSIAPRTTAEKPARNAVSSPKPLFRDAKFEVSDMLRIAIRNARPLLVAIFGDAIIAPLREISRNLPSDLRVSDGESSIRFQVRWAATALSISSMPAYIALKKAAAIVQDMSDWDRIILQAKQTLDPEEFEPTKLGNADVPCKAVFRLLQML